MPYAYMNIVVTFGVLLVMLIIFLHAYYKESPAVLADRKTYPSVFAAFWFYFFAYLCVFILYALVWFLNWLTTVIAPENLGPPHAAVHVVESLFSGVGGTSLLMASFAYRRGREFDFRGAIQIVYLVAAGMFCWGVFWELMSHSNNLLWSSIKVAPEVIISAIAMFSLGWVFFVRWSSATVLLYFVVTAVYAILQFPAYLAAELGPFFKDASPLNISFAFLAGGKIVVAYGFISLLLASTPDVFDINEPQHWFGPRVKPPKWIFPRIGGWIGGLIIALVFALIAPWLLQRLSSLWSLIRCYLFGLSCS
jgi:hypothetical protein